MHLHPPYLGAAYYPEGQSPQRIASDIRQMAETGVNVVRIGEFAWSRMEPADGQFDFSWLHAVVDQLAAAGIGVILCTPSATPPIWLTQKHPEILPMRHDGRRTTHGARLHYCPNNAVYRSYIARVNRRLAQEFADCPSVLGWQVDNEVMIPFWQGCFCPDCQAGFRAFLQRRYGSIGALNEAWQLTLWSQEYASFDQIPAPNPDVWHHPSLKTAWMEFGEASVVDYVEQQIATLRACTDKPVSTDTMPFLHVGHEKLLRQADLVMFNHYNDPGNLYHAMFWLDYLKTVKPAPLWVTETDPCGNGSTALQPYKPRGFCTVNSWLPFLFGGEANLYWHWRGHRAGQEIMHGTVIDSAGRPTHTYEEICKLAADLKKAAPFLSGTRPQPARVAVHLSDFAFKLLDSQPICGALHYIDAVRDRFYLPLLEAGVRVDVITPGQDLAPYDVVFSPLLACLDEDGLRQRLAQWIEQGGTWIAGPLTDVRNRDCAKFDGPFGSLEAWGGVYLRRFLCADPAHPFRATGPAGDTAASFWCDGFSPVTATALAVYDQASAELAGLAAVTENPMGRGRVVTLGTVPDAAFVAALAQRYAGAPDRAWDASSNVCCVARQGEAGDGLLLAEYRNQPGSLTLRRRAVDLLTGRAYEGMVPIAPYSVMVLQFA